MISFKRDIYKLKAPPRPPRPSIQFVWYRSISQVKGTVDYCLPITTQIFKNPNSTPITVGDYLYTDFQETSPLTPQNGGTEPIYNIDSQSLSNPTGQSNIKSVEVNGFGEVVSINQGSCNPSLDLVSIYITEVTPTSSEGCGRVNVTYEVKVHSDDLDSSGSTIPSSAQLYDASSTNSAPQPLDPNNIPTDIYTGFDGTSFNFVGVGLTSSPQNTQPFSSFRINSGGFIDNPATC